jgi:hypothetical protein
LLPFLSLIICLLTPDEKRYEKKCSKKESHHYHLSWIREIHEYVVKYKGNKEEEGYY